MAPLAHAPSWKKNPAGTYDRKSAITERIMFLIRQSHYRLQLFPYPTCRVYTV